MTRDQEQGAWRVLYITVASWNHHPKGLEQNGTWIAQQADKLLMELKRQENLRWPDGQQQHK